MTDAERTSTGWSNGKRKRVVFPLALVVTVATLLASGLFVAPDVGQADPLSSAQAQAAQINSELQTDSAHADALSQQYEAAQQKVVELDAQESTVEASITSDRKHVQQDQVNLRHEAIASYISTGNGAGLDTLFMPAGENSAVAQQYRAVASSNISNAVDSLNLAERSLDAQEQQLQVLESQAQGAASSAAAAKQSADQLVASQQATLNGLNGQIATLVQQQQAAEQAAQHAAFDARVAQEQASSSPASGSSGSGSTGAAPTLGSLPAAGGAAAAVAAAESQLGVPYVWGGETPGVGFDCSGLTQWAWGQAGVSIPRTAQDQYDAIAHVSLSDLQPGDLVFWSDGSGVSHVGMYVGGGSVIHAPETGTVVQITPIWNDGLVGAGRP